MSLWDLRKNWIPEGAGEEDFPPFCGWGRIASGKSLNEKFFTLKAFGRRLFIARGNYETVWTGPPHKPSFRWWVRQA